MSPAGLLVSGCKTYRAEGPQPKSEAHITERGPGFVTASVVDPFGNVLAVMYNQHYLDIVDSVKVV
ncbi:hypothetical protein QR64_22695 [Rhodococcus sp. Chr-9]|nr:hypothetical protein QR64_22695 [Rhodococcus sp. Chr-9]OBA32102.1 hypothetical protein A5767_18325 [Rhodococcus sp. 852002-51564_SCH6189132-a]